MSEVKTAPDLRENKMGSMPLGKLLFNMALPLVLSMLVQALYNVVDSVYVARYSQNAVTALSLAFPIQNLQIGFATGAAVGMNSLLSKSLGEGNQKRANQAAGNGIFLTLVFVAVFMLFGFFGAGAYYNMQNISAETAKAGTDYTSICCIYTGGVFIGCRLPAKPFTPCLPRVPAQCSISSWIPCLSSALNPWAFPRWVLPVRQWLP